MFFIHRSSSIQALRIFFSSKITEFEIEKYSSFLGCDGYFSSGTEKQFYFDSAGSFLKKDFGI